MEIKTETVVIVNSCWFCVDELEVSEFDTLNMKTRGLTNKISCKCGRVLKERNPNGTP